MYVRWQSRKRNRPDIGPYASEVLDDDGYRLQDRRGGLLRTRKRADGTLAQDVRWTAILVESVRVDGEPRQRHIAFLASITDSRIAVDNQRRYFWDHVYDRLDHLGNRIPLEDRKKIEAAIALKVPRLSRAEHAASITYVRSCGLFTEERIEEAGLAKPYRAPI